MDTEIPKKIWQTHDFNGAIQHIEYIRADIVEDMREALEFCCELLECSGRTALKGRAALKRLEGE